MTERMFDLFILWSPGASLHHQLSEKGHAERVWKGLQEEGADSQPGGDLPQDREGAPDLTWRLPQPCQDAGEITQRRDVRYVTSSNI